MPMGSGGSLSSSVLTSTDQTPVCDATALLPSTSALLTEGGDQRIRLDPLTGLNRYGCPPAPAPGLAAFGSSTASAISPLALDAAGRLRDRLQVQLRTASPEAVYERETSRLKAELIDLCGLQQVKGLQAVIAASGEAVRN